MCKSQASQPFNDLQRQLIASINMQRQASTILLANVDQMVPHRFTLDQTLFTAHPGAFLPMEERDLFHLDQEPAVYGDLNSSYSGLLFQDSGLETPDLASHLPDSVPEEDKMRVLLAVKESHTRNCERVQNLDSITRSLYTTASDLVNDGMEGGDCSQCLAAVYFEEKWAFIKPTTSKNSSKPGKDKAISCAMSSATNAAKKKKSRGKGRKNQGLPPHAAPHPFSPATLTPAPAASPAHYGGVDTRKQ